MRSAPDCSAAQVATRSPLAQVQVCWWAGPQLIAHGDASTAARRVRMFTCMERAKVVAPIGLGGCGRGLAQHADDLPGPLLLGGVQFENAFGVTDQVRGALPDPGELGVELVPADVVVTDQVAGVALEHAQIGEGGRCREPLRASLASVPSSTPTEPSVGWRLGNTCARSPIVEGQGLIWCPWADL